MRRNSNGFTLIELLMVVSIIGILLAVAFPSYRQHIARSNRAEARAALLTNAQFLERNFTEWNCYHRSDASCATAAVTVVLPKTRTPDNGSQAYTIGFSGTATSTTYTLQAVPTSGGPMDGDACGTLTLTNLGVKGAGGTVEECWNR